MLVNMRTARVATGVLVAACVCVPVTVCYAQSTSPQAARREPTPSFAVSQQRALLDGYCIGCHNQRAKAAGSVPLALDTLDPSQVGADAATWEKVVRKLRSGMMPPAGRPAPDTTSRSAFLSRLETDLDRAAAAVPNPGRPAIHRLNRVEYTNAIRDLLALEIDGPSLLPGDDAGYGFDNIADVLTVSPSLLERYLFAATKISRRAVGDPAIRPSIATYQLPYLSLLQEDRMSEDLPFGSRGGLVVPHHFPLDGEYAIRIRLQRNSLNIGYEIRGLDEENEIDVRLDGALIKRFSIGGENTTEQDRTAGYKETEDTEDAGLYVRIPVKAGPHSVGVTFRNTTWYVEGVGVSRLPAASDSFASGKQTERTYGKIQMGVDSIDIAGPFDATAPDETPSRRRIFVCRPTDGQDEEACAKTILSTLARRAYRRPVTEDEIRTLTAFFEAGRSQGGFEAGIQQALERLLVSPNFLFRVERDPVHVEPGTAYRLSDLELASRLSFFLWSSIPDDELLDLAARGSLEDAAVLEQQVRRMLADDRASALTGNFFGQWLHVRNVRAIRPDPVAFPEFDDSLRDAFRRETELFLEAQLREDRPVTELLTADHTFLNERLARHYGIPNLYGSHFRRVPLGDDTRAGILGHGSVLTVTSYANRTSPVVRGKWVLENLLATPPPAPPANVPPLEENEAGRPTTSMRERMEQHRRNPVCAACHSKMDPLGFAFENFDGIGKWRTLEADTRIDPSGTFPDGTRFDSPATFRNALLAHEEVFVGALIEKLLTYALGRGVEYYDMPVVRQIMGDSASSGYSWSAIILGIVNSTPFQMRRAEA